MAQRRLLAWVPQWSLHVAQAGYPPTTPAAVATPRTIIDVSAAARQGGVRPGMRVRQARALMPELALLPPDPERAQRAFEGVLHALTTVRWDVSAWRPGLAQAPLGSLGTPAGEADLVARATEAIAYHTGADASVGIADGTLAGLVAASRALIVPPDRQAALLAPLPLSWLPLVYDTGPTRHAMAAFVDRLATLGLTTLGDIQDLPAGALAGRFGREGALVACLAGGGDWPLEGTACTDADLEVTRECDPPLGDVEQAVFAAKSLTDALFERLRSRGLALARVRIACGLAPGESRARTWILDPPAREHDVLTRVRWHLGQWLSDPDSARGGVRTLTLTACAVVSASELASVLWGEGDAGVQARRARQAAAQVSRLVGSSGVLFLRRQGGFDPRSQVVVSAWDAPCEELADLRAPWPGSLGGPSPAVVCDEPRRVGLVDAAGLPVELDDAGQLSAPPTRVVVALGDERAIEDVGGPYRVNGMWWEPDGDQAPRSYLILACPDGPDLLLVHRDDQWWHEGTYEGERAVLR